MGLAHEGSGRSVLGRCSHEHFPIGWVEDERTVIRCDVFTNHFLGRIERQLAARREDSIAIIVLVEFFGVIRSVRFDIALSITAKDSLSCFAGVKTAHHVQSVDLRN
jgi:hypothetical protein